MNNDGHERQRGQLGALQSLGGVSVSAVEGRYQSQIPSPGVVNLSWWAVGKALLTPLASDT